MITVSTAFGLLVLFAYHCSKIVKIWNEVTNRHRAFFLFSLYFVLFFGFLIIFGLGNSYDEDAIKVLIIFPLANMYIFTLQYLWRFSKRGKQEIDELILESKQPELRELEIARKGLDYFNDDFEIEVLKKENIVIPHAISFDSENSVGPIEDNFIKPPSEVCVKQEDEDYFGKIQLGLKDSSTKKIKKNQLNEEEIRARFSSIDKQFEKAQFSKKVDTDRIVNNEKLKEEKQNSKPSKKEGLARTSIDHIEERNSKVLKVDQDDSKVFDQSDANLLNQSSIINDQL